MNKQWEIQTGREKPSLFQQRCGSSLRKHPFLLALRRWRRFARRRARRNGCFRWLCGSRDSTNQNALFVEWFSRLRRVVFRGVYGEIFALFQACVGNFYTIRPWKYVGTLNLDSSYVTFKYFAFLSVCDSLNCSVKCKPPWWFECCFCRSSWIHCWLLLAVLSGYFGHLVTSTFLLCKFRGLPESTPVSFPVMSRWKCLGIKRSSQPSSTTPAKRAEKTCRDASRSEASNAKSRKSLFYFKPEKVNKLEYCNVTFGNKTFFIT